MGPMILGYHQTTNFQLRTATKKTPGKILISAHTGNNTLHSHFHPTIAWYCTATVPVDRPILSCVTAFRFDNFLNVKCPDDQVLRTVVRKPWWQRPQAVHGETDPRIAGN